MVTPNSYKTLPVEARQFYVAGVLDTESRSLPQVFAAIRDCVKGSDLQRLTAMVDKGLTTMDPTVIEAMSHKVGFRWLTTWHRSRCHDRAVMFVLPTATRAFHRRVPDGRTCWRHGPLYLEQAPEGRA